MPIGSGTGKHHYKGAYLEFLYAVHEQSAQYNMMVRELMHTVCMGARRGRFPNGVRRSAGHNVAVDDFQETVVGDAVKENKAGAKVYTRSQDGKAHRSPFVYSDKDAFAKIAKNSCISQLRRRFRRWLEATSFVRESSATANSYQPSTVEEIKYLGGYLFDQLQLAVPDPNRAAAAESSLVVMFANAFAVELEGETLVAATRRPGLFTIGESGWATGLPVATSSFWGAFGLENVLPGSILLCADGPRHPTTVKLSSKLSSTRHQWIARHRDVSDARPPPSLAANTCVVLPGNMQSAWQATGVVTQVYDGASTAGRSVGAAATPPELTSTALVNRRLVRCISAIRVERVDTVWLGGTVLAVYESSSAAQEALQTAHRHSVRKAAQLANCHENEVWCTIAWEACERMGWDAESKMQLLTQRQYGVASVGGWHLEAAGATTLAAAHTASRLDSAETFRYDVIREGGDGRAEKGLARSALRTALGLRELGLLSVASDVSPDAAELAELIGLRADGTLEQEEYDSEVAKLEPRRADRLRLIFFHSARQRARKATNIQTTLDETHARPGAPAFAQRLRNPPKWSVQVRDTAVVRKTLPRPVIARSLSHSGWHAREPRAALGRTHRPRRLRCGERCGGARVARAHQDARSRHEPRDGRVAAAEHVPSSQRRRPQASHGEPRQARPRAVFGAKRGPARALEADASAARDAAGVENGAVRGHVRTLPRARERGEADLRADRARRRAQAQSRSPHQPPPHPARPSRRRRRRGDERAARADRALRPAAQDARGPPRAHRGG